jgi:hypothetical protein
MSLSPPVTMITASAGRPRSSHRLDEAAVPDADRGHARISRGAIGHQSAAGHAHRRDAAGLDLLVEPARLSLPPCDPVECGDQRRPSVMSPHRLASWRATSGPPPARAAGRGPPPAGRPPAVHPRQERHRHSRHLRPGHRRVPRSRQRAVSHDHEAVRGELGQELREREARSSRSLLPPTPTRRVSRYRDWRPIDGVRGQGLVVLDDDRLDGPVGGAPRCGTLTTADALGLAPVAGAAVCADIELKLAPAPSARRP